MGGAVAKQPFSWAAWIGGLAFALVCAGGGAFFAGLVAMTLENAVLGGLIGAAPGVLFGFGSRRLRQNGFGQGVLIGAVLMMLVGGFCGAAMNDFKIR